MGSPSLSDIAKYNSRRGRSDFKPIQCRMCKRISPTVSWGGLCPHCGIEKCKRVARAIKDKKGPYYQRWRKGMKKFISEL